MKLRLFALTFLTLSLLQTAAHAQGSAQLKPVLAQLDAASARFKSARAEFQWDQYERVVRDHTIQTGPIYFERKGTATQMGAVVTDKGSSVAGKVLEYRDGTLQMFSPAQNHIDVVKAGGNQAKYEGFLTLGFGGSGRDLERVWNITDQGSENLSDNGKPVKVEKLDLVAKDPSVRTTFTHVTIWIDLTRGVSLKQFFETPGGDTRTATYSHIALNGPVDTKTFEIKRDKKTVVAVH